MEKRKIMNTLEILRMKKLAGLITEHQYRAAINEEENPEQILNSTPSDIQNSLANFLNISQDELEQQVLDNEKEIKESIALTVILALPLLLEVAGSAINKVKTLTLSGEDKKFYQNWKERKKAAKKAKDKNQLEILKKEYQDKFASRYGEALIGAGHSLHKAYTWPIVQVLKLGSLLPGKFGDWARDENTRQKVADILYAITVIFYAGIHAKAGLENILTKHNVDPVNFITSIIDTVKSGKSLRDVVGYGLALAIPANQMPFSNTEPKPENIKK